MRPKPRIGRPPQAPIKIPCAACHKFFRRLRLRSKYCSRACSGFACRQPRPEMKCETCHKAIPFEKTHFRYDRKHKQTKFCSKICADIAKRSRPYQQTYSALRKGAKREKKKLTLTYDAFVRIIQDNPCCHYCHNPVPRIKHGPGNYQLDRIINELGYHDDNVVVCCWPCNRGKGGDRHFSFNEWFAMTECFRLAGCRQEWNKTKFNPAIEIFKSRESTI